MRLEDTLAELGNEPVSKLPNYRALLAFVNGNLTKLGIKHLDGKIPSDEMLETIYSLEDETLKTLVLDRTVVDLYKDKRFKNVLLGSMVVITVVIIGVFVVSLFGATPMSPETIDLLKVIGSGFLEIIKSLLVSSAT